MNKTIVIGFKCGCEFHIVINGQSVTYEPRFIDRRDHTQQLPCGLKQIDSTDVKP